VAQLHDRYDDDDDDEDDDDDDCVCVCVCVCVCLCGLDLHDQQPMILVGLLATLKLKMEAQRFPETSTTIRQSTLRNIPLDLNLPQQLLENPKISQ
jgi:hypothetical protein